MTVKTPSVWLSKKCGELVYEKDICFKNERGCSQEQFKLDNSGWT